MAGYTRQTTFTTGNTIEVADFNNEFNQLLAAFNNTTGHKHDGTAAEGPVINLIGDTLATPLNKILVDTASNHLEFYVDVSSAAVQQLRIQDGAIVPILDNDIDLGTGSLEFKDYYVIQPPTNKDIKINDYSTNNKKEKGKKVANNFEYNSLTNQNKLSINQIKKLLKNS